MDTQETDTVIQQASLTEDRVREIIKEAIEENNADLARMVITRQVTLDNRILKDAV